MNFHLPGRVLTNPLLKEYTDIAYTLWSSLGAILVDLSGEKNLFLRRATGTLHAY